MTLIIRRPVPNTLRVITTEPRLGEASGAVHSEKGRAYLLRRISLLANHDSRVLAFA